jgi:chromosome segregation ATPase
VINAYISNVPDAVKRSSGSKTGAKKSMRYQMQALQQFRDNLADSLRSITFAQHSFYRFGSEVRKARKRKRELREELMGRRREREEVELEIERVRSEHLKAEREHEKQRRLVDDLESIEAAVKRGREEGKDGGGPLQSVVADAEDVAARLGVLKRVRDFNAFLAKTAEAL